MFALVWIDWDRVPFFPGTGAELILDSGWEFGGYHTDGFIVAEQGFPSSGLWSA